MEEEPKQKKPRKAAAPKAPKPPKSVEELVLHALTLAAKNPKAKWSGAKTALFPSSEPNVEAAIKLCLDEGRPLLKQTGTAGTPTSAGFELVAADLPPEEVGALAKSVVERLPLDEREAFINDAIGRTPQASAELTPLLADIIAGAKTESDAKVAAALKEKQAHDTATAALARAQQLLAESLENKKDALRRQYAALGGDPSELRDPDPVPKRKTEPTGGTKVPPVPQTDEEKDFRRYTADRLASAWRDALDAGASEGREYLEAAIWNIRGMKMLGEPNARVAFDGLHHMSDDSLFTGDAARVVRPGWLLEIDDEKYVPLKALVAKG